MKTGTFTRCRNHSVCVTAADLFPRSRAERCARAQQRKRSFLQLPVSILRHRSRACGHWTAEKGSSSKRKEKTKKGTEGAPQWSCHTLCFPHKCENAWRQTFQGCGDAQLIIFNIQIIQVCCIYIHIYTYTYIYIPALALHAYAGTASINPEISNELSFTVQMEYYWYNKQ